MYLKKYFNSERTILYLDRTINHFAVNVPEINRKTTVKNQTSLQNEEKPNNDHKSFENSVVCLFNLYSMNVTMNKSI